MAKNIYNPDFAIHPGKTLEDTLRGYKMTQADLSKRTGLAKKTINEIVRGKNPITPHTAVKLSSVFGISEEFWRNLQTQYDETVMRLETESWIKTELRLLKRFPYLELSRLDYVETTSVRIERIKNLHNFFGVSSLTFVSKIHEVAFRKSKFQNLSMESLATWLRCGELKAQKIKTAEFNRKKLLSSIPRIRSLTRTDPSYFQKELVKICASFGVAVTFTPHFKNTHVNGACKWLNPYKAMIQLSLRGRFSDIFWFAFFHELGHIVRDNKKDQFVDFDGNGIKGSESQANKFANKSLVPPQQYSEFFKRKEFSDQAIAKFAKQVNISSSIIAGRLAHDLKSWEEFCHLRTRLEFK